MTNGRAGFSAFTRDTVLVAGLFASVFGCSAESKFRGNRDNRSTDKVPAVEEPAIAKANEIEDPKTENGIETNLESESDWVFPLADEGKVSQSFDLVSRTANVSLNMLNESVRLSQTMMQPARPVGQFEKRQGSAEFEKTDSFSQSNIGILDILIVVDDSSSMSQEQVNLSTKLSALLQSVKSTNWQIAVVTTDKKKKNLRALIRSGEPNVDSAFASAVRPGTGGSTTEEGVWQSLAGLSQNVLGKSGSWLRTNSTVAVLIVSDEDNCSRANTGCKGKAHDSEKYFLDGVKTLRKVGQDLRVYGLFSVPGTVCKTAPNVGITYQKLVEATNGKSGSICDSDFTATLSAMSSNIKATLKSQFQLSAVPKAGTVVVKVNGKVVSGTQVQGDVVEFAANALPPNGSTISISYKVSGSQEKFEFVTLPEAPGEGTLEVFLDGKPLLAASFQFNSASRRLSFLNPVPAGVLMSARWKQGELDTVFHLGADAVGLDNVIARDASGATLATSFEKATGVLRFVNALPEGSVFNVSGEGVFGKKTQYPAPRVVGKLLGANHDDGSQVPVR